MTPAEEKYKQLSISRCQNTIREVANNMQLYYIGIGQEELEEFWRQIEKLAKR